MKEIIVASDSHGRGDLLKKLEQSYPNADLFLHTGDLEEDPLLYPKWIFVRGNNDWFFDVPDSRTIKVGDHKIFMTHGHLFGYRNRLQSMAAAAKENGADILLSGHSHSSDVETINGVTCVNPGSLWYPRDGNPPSYARILLEDGKEPEVQIVFENHWPFIPNRPKKGKRGWFR